jgi:hypothetical protein
MFWDRRLFPQQKPEQNNKACNDNTKAGHNSDVIIEQKQERRRSPDGVSVMPVSTPRKKHISQFRCSKLST